jgi:hypothetical protein
MLWVIIATDLLIGLSSAEDLCLGLVYEVKKYLNPRLLADGSAERRQLPGLLGHQTRYRLPRQKQQLKARLTKAVSAITHNIVLNMWTEVEYRLSNFRGSRGADTANYEHM